VLVSQSHSQSRLTDFAARTRRFLIGILFPSPQVNSAEFDPVSINHDGCSSKIFFCSQFAAHVEQGAPGHYLSVTIANILQLKDFFGRLREVDFLAEEPDLAARCLGVSTSDILEIHNARGNAFASARRHIARAGG
jgi:hypothetical protein